MVLWVSSLVGARARDIREGFLEEVTSCLRGLVVAHQPFLHKAGPHGGGRNPLPQGPAAVVMRRGLEVTVLAILPTSPSWL